MLKNAFIIFSFFASFFATMTVSGWEFEQNIVLEGVLRRAEQTVIKNYNGKKEARVEKSIVLVTDKPLTLTHSIISEKQQIASTNVSYPHIGVYLSQEFTPLIGKYVQCSGTFRKTFDFIGDEIVFDVDVAIDCEQPSHMLKTLFYEPEDVEVSGFLHETIYPGPPEYMSVEMGDYAEKVIILTLKEPINVEIKDGQEVEDDFNEPEKGVRELQIGFQIPSLQQTR